MPCPVRDILYAGTKQNATGNPDTGYLQINEQVYLPEWLDRFNKNGKKDVYEDPTVPIDARVEDLLRR